MPVYEYQCKKCGRTFEYQMRMSDPDKSVCEACGAPELEKLISHTAFALKGGGWYKDLYASTKPEGAAAPAADAKPAAPASVAPAAAPVAPTAAAPATPAAPAAAASGTSSGSGSGGGSSSGGGGTSTSSS